MLVAKKIKHNFSNSFFKASVIVVLFVMSLILVPQSNNSNVYASPQDDLNAINSQLDATNKSLEAKQSEVKTLGDQVNVLNEQINQVGLQIQATQTKIQILGQQIAQTEVDLKTQQETLNEYLRVIYEESNTSPLEQIASANSFSDFVDKSEYLQTMQIKIRDTVDKVKQMKADLENNKKETERMKDQLSTQRSDLSNKKSAQSSLLAVAQNNAALLQEDVKTLTSKKGALACLIRGGCGGDPNGDLTPVNDLSFPYYSQGDYGMLSWGCLVTSYAMVRSHLTGKTITPTDEAAAHGFDSYGIMQGSGEENYHRDPPDWGLIDSSLNRGIPVIVGLDLDNVVATSNPSDTHYVVIVSHSGKTYSINDPYPWSPLRKWNTSRVFKALYFN